jgi:hypothetical protein
MAVIVPEGVYEATLPHRISRLLEEFRPCVFRVDERRCLATSEDVAIAIRNGLFPSSQAHYNEAGWPTRRSPSARLVKDVQYRNDLISICHRS